MKNTIGRFLRQTCSLWVLVAAAPLVGAQTPSPAPAAPAAATPAVTPDPDQVSYTFGLTFGEQMHSVGITDQVSIDAIARGLKDGLQGKRSNPADRQQVQLFVRSVMEAGLAHNKAAAKDFLASNGREKGIVTTASGLEYKIVAPGDRKAAAIAPADEVTVQYRGKLLDGSEFDSSYAHGTPATFRVNGVIQGWQEALVLMKPGAKWQLFVPPELGYGATPKPGIPGNSLLIFDVEVVSVKPQAAAPGTVPAHPDVKPAPKSN